MIKRDMPEVVAVHRQPGGNVEDDVDDDHHGEDRAFARRRAVVDFPPEPLPDLVGADGEVAAPAEFACACSAQSLSSSRP